MEAEAQVERTTSEPPLTTSRPPLTSTNPEPLRLACGHLLSDVETGDEGTSYCAGCEREAASDSGQVALPVVRPATSDEPGNGEASSRPLVRHATTSAPGTSEADSEPTEEHVRTDSEAGPGTLTDRSRALAHKGEEPSQDGADSDPPQPMYGTRADVPGPRGCWALKADGTACGASRRGDSDFCTAHAGIGVAADPKRHGENGLEARKRNSVERARLRLLLGNTRIDTPRGALKAKAFVQAERLAGRVIDAALDDEADPLKAGSLALRVIESVDPAARGVLDVSTELTKEGVEGLGLSQLLALAAEHGIEPISPAQTPPALPAGETS